MPYVVIYDGNCNLCANFVSILEKFDRGRQFCYIPMQDDQTLQQFNVTTEDCEMGMILVDRIHPSQCKIRQVTKEKNGSTRKTEK